MVLTKGLLKLHLVFDTRVVFDSIRLEILSRIDKREADLKKK